MDYLTHHYKNLSEQLQQKVNHLQHLIRLSEENGDTNIKKKEEITKKEVNPKDYPLNKNQEYKESLNKISEPDKAKYAEAKEKSMKDAERKRQEESLNKISEADKAKYAEAKEKSMKDAERKRQEEKPKPYTEKAPLKPIDVDIS